jgi:hypothetical protein
MGRLVTFEMAHSLAEKGFNKYCADGYFIKSHIDYSIPNNDSVFESEIGKRIFDIEYCWFEDEIEIGSDIIYAPTEMQVMEWLRDEKKIYIMIDRSFAVSNSWHYVIVVDDDFENLIQQESTPNKGWDDALRDAIEYSVNNLI